MVTWNDVLIQSESRATHAAWDGLEREVALRSALRTQGLGTAQSEADRTQNSDGFSPETVWLRPDRATIEDGFLAD